MGGVAVALPVVVEPSWIHDACPILVSAGEPGVVVGAFGGFRNGQRSPRTAPKKLPPALGSHGGNQKVAFR